MFLDDLRNRRSSLDASISQQERSLKQLKDEREAVQRQLDGFVYPILSIPPEITSDIFVWCSALDLGSPDSARPPLLLLQVCRAWRAIALSVPALWDMIHDLECRVPEIMENLITTWFSRAGARPLSLELTYVGESESFHMHSLIRQHASRLQFLDLYTDGNCFFDLADIRPFPLLRTLTLGSFNGMLKDTGTPIAVFSGAPLLRHLSLEAIAPSALLMPWAQLTKFVAIELSLHDCLGALRSATSLCEFERGFSTPEEEEESISDEPLFCHSRLNSLFIHANDGVDYNILEFLALPGLQELQLGARFGEWTEDLNTIVLDFLSRTFPTLRKFTVGMSPSVPIQWLHITTHLTTLDLIRPRTAREVVRALDRNNAPDFLPQLQNLTYSECTSDQVDTELLDALNSRCAADGTDPARAAIQSFRLIWPEYPNEPPTAIPPSPLASLRALVSRGMRIHVGTPDHNTFY
ncbi:hypothetical protein DFH09DRAFT_1021343 [Mycena vulgaris]|nr:hypothetical protein DFH09DRAFT_1021343 [Mycena vulgaris]